MADQATMFGDGAPASASAAQPTPAAPASPDPGVLGVLVGEGRKYRDIDALVKGHLNADEHISRIEDENRRLREQVKSAATMDEVLKKLNAAPATPAGSTPGADQGQSKAPDIAELVKQTVTGLETEKVRLANRLRAEAAMKELFGEKAKETFEAQAPTAAERATLQQLAEVSPEKFIALFKPAAAPMPGMAQGTTNTGAPMGTGDRTLDPGAKEYWDTMRRKEPNRYYSSEMQLARDKAARQNRDKFFGTK